MNEKYISYRVTFSYDTLKMENAADLSKCPEIYYNIIQILLKWAQEIGIKHIWFFYEPYVEITWLVKPNETGLSDKFNEVIEFILAKNNITNAQFFNTTKDEFGPDWFCKSEQEMYFGAKRYSICRQFVELYNEYKIPVDTGKTLKEQVKRTIHGLCNPLGLNYKDEAYICFSRGLICLLFCLFSFKKAVWIYTKIFRQKF